MPVPIHVAIAIVLLAWSASTSIAREQVHTDANLLTALDVSDSIMRHEEWLEFDGLAKAVVSGAVLDAIAGGRHGRIGFAAITWSSAGRFEIVVPWTLIESTGDAERVATALREFAIDRSSWKRRRDRSSRPEKLAEFRTDVSASVDFALQMALSAPHPSARTVVNLCANGADNVGEGPRAARDRAIAAGVVINGLVIGSQQRLANYFREFVQAGVGSFVMEVAQPAALVEAMIDKLLRDLVATRQLPPGVVPFT